MWNQVDRGAPYIAAASTILPWAANYTLHTAKDYLYDLIKESGQSFKSGFVSGALQTGKRIASGHGIFPQTKKVFTRTSSSYPRSRSKYSNRNNYKRKSSYRFPQSVRFRSKRPRKQMLFSSYPRGFRRFRYRPRSQYVYNRYKRRKRRYPFGS